MTSLRVLLADDHVPTLEELRDALQDDPRFAVVAAVGHAAAAVSEAVQTRPDLCVLDIRMPGSGIAAIPPTLVARMVHHFRGRAPRRRQLAEPAPLTSREWEVLELMSRKLTNSQIARELSVSSITVRTHVSGILRKLRVPDRQTAVRMFSDQCP